MNRFIPVLLAAFLVAVPLAGCGGSSSNSGTQISLPEEQTVTIGLTDIVEVGDDAVLRLQDVEDNRCPTGAACLRYEPSYASIGLFDAETSAPTATVRIAEDTDNENVGETLTSPRTGVSYRIRLQSIAPERPSDRELPLEEYRVTIRVQRVR